MESIALIICGLALVGGYLYVTCLSDVYVRTDRNKPAVKMNKAQAISYRRANAQSLTDKLNDSSRWFPKQ